MACDGSKLVFKFIFLPRRQKILGDKQKLSLFCLVISEESGFANPSRCSQNSHNEMFISYRFTGKTMGSFQYPYDTTDYLSLLYFEFVASSCKLLMSLQIQIKVILESQSKELGYICPGRNWSGHQS